MEFVKRHSSLPLFFIINVFILGQILLTEMNAIDKLTIFFAMLLTAMAITTRYIYAIFAIYLALLTSVMVHVHANWGDDFIGARFETMLESPITEMSEYLSTFVGLADVTNFLHLIVSLALIIYVFHRKSKVTGSEKKCSVAFLILSIPVFGFLYFYKFERFFFYMPVNVTGQLIDIYNRSNQKALRQEFLEANHPTSRTCTVDYSNIVIILGESATRDRMGIYGYEKDTTPFLNSHDRIQFDAIAPANLTRYSVPMLLTDANVENFDAFFESHSVLASLNSCGYETYWVSNQGQMGIADTYNASIGQEADQVIHLNEGDFTDANQDGVVLEEFEKLLTHESNKKAFVIHLMGSHFNYKERYPAEFNIFGDEKISQQYDNSIYYNDYILSQINGLVKDPNSIFLYVSDHGEVLDDMGDLMGHGLYPSFQEEYRVPFVVWSKDVIDENRQKLDHLQDISREKTLNLESFKSFVEYLIGYNSEPALSFNDNIVAVIPLNVEKYSELKTFSTSKELPPKN